MKGRHLMEPGRANRESGRCEAAEANGWGRGQIGTERRYGGLGEAEKMFMSVGLTGDNGRTRRGVVRAGHWIDQMGHGPLAMGGLVLGMQS